jgi:hypothetical protein
MTDLLLLALGACFGATLVMTYAGLRYGRAIDHPSTTDEAADMRDQLYGDPDVYAAYYDDVWTDADDLVVTIPWHRCLASTLGDIWAGIRNAFDWLIRP